MSTLIPTGRTWAGSGSQSFEEGSAYRFQEVSIRRAEWPGEGGGASPATTALPSAGSDSSALTTAAGTCIRAATSAALSGPSGRTGVIGCPTGCRGGVARCGRTHFTIIPIS
ncbi:hypothetical protein ABB07_05915 [Streptomyces incarnatus]|uniref:Uncharacterized protein n=1 Tax=Streptomyces incarnatus TaxID=665007 RepID=A0ABN4GCS5_9ACTN|nr:hypothetical protein ABB07_05915 [Streptomyces incarnatus]